MLISFHNAWHMVFDDDDDDDYKSVTHNPDISFRLITPEFEIRRA